MQHNEELSGRDSTESPVRSTGLSRRDFLRGAAAGAALLGLNGLLPGSLGYSEGATADAIDVLPVGLKELVGGKVWFGAHSQAVSDALLRKLLEFRTGGAIDDVAFGADKGSLFFKGSNSRFYEFAVGSRGVYHLAGGKVVAALVMRDLASGRIQLDPSGKQFFELPPEARTVLAARPVVGEPESEAPSLPSLRGRLTVAGQENRDQSTLGQPALKTLGRMGSLSRVTNSREVPVMAVASYQNGHNLPQGTLDFIRGEYAAKAFEILGLPISDPYWVRLGSPEQPAWVLVQVFEASIVTFNPKSSPKWQYQASPAGNLLVATLNNGNEDFPSLKGLDVPVSQTRRSFENKVGWAFTSKPECTFEEIWSDLFGMRENGSNAIYLTHNNPGDVNPYGKEPGLAFSVFFALRYNTYVRSHAKRIYAAVLNALDAARTLNLDVVLPLGYQIAMGQDWNSLHGEDLRRDANGSLMNHWGSGVTASPYSPSYRRDIVEYYRWVNDTILRRYHNVIAVNVADEPMGSDFSPWARQAFLERYGVDFEAASDEQRGEFLSGVIADYLSWSANVWKEINPRIWVTSSLHIQRDLPWFPDVETIFEKTPDNFVVSADTHLHDKRMDLPITDEDINLLRLLTRTLGWLSHVYEKPLWLWTSANAWGLAGRSSRPGGIPEAELNLSIVSGETRRNGGSLGMVTAWAYNVIGQDLTNVSPDQMFAAISRDLSSLRGTLPNKMNGSPEQVIALDRMRLYGEAGKSRASLLLEIDNVDLQGQYGDLIRDKNTVFLRSGKALDEALKRGAGVISI